MRVILFNGNRLTKLVLPKKVEGSFWLTDELNGNANIVNVEAQNGQWILKENDEAKIIYNNEYVTSLQLITNIFCFIEYDRKKYFTYIEGIVDDSIKSYKINENIKLSLGRSENSHIIYNSEFIFDKYIQLDYSVDIGWRIIIQPNSMVYINNNLLQLTSEKLEYGDVIFVLGLRIVVLKNAIFINNPLNKVIINTSLLGPMIFKPLDIEQLNEIKSESIREINFYKDDDYFFKKPRMRRFIESYNLKISNPPSKQQEEDRPLILTLGPMLGMAATSVITATNSVIRIITNYQGILRTILSLAPSLVSLLGTLLWPNLIKRYSKKQAKKKEKERKIKYRQYLEKKRKEIYDVYINQTQILKENLISLEECENIILKKKRTLWERRIDQQDFLTIRAGFGEVPLKMNTNLEKDEFSIEEDELRTEALKLLDEFKVIKDVPVGYSFYNKNITAIMGKTYESLKFLDGIILQLLTFHSYDDLKLVFMVSKKNIGFWEKYKEVPHCFTNNKQIRFFADNEEDVRLISSYLEQEYIKRAYSKNNDEVENEDKNNKRTFSPNYLIITDDYTMIRKNNIINFILKNKINLGFGIVCVENRLGKLPSECVNFISLEGRATILSIEKDNYYQQEFMKEINKNVRIKDCINILSNVPIEFVEDLRSLPMSLGFLEMFRVGKVEQLNALNRWRLNDPIKSLRAMIGINDEGNPIYLDLHEKYHGPHGLIAGTTGSGKSEFIITYILSMAINYSPNEVAFILIDYKGGGLAGAFENKTLGYRLPHLAGTITNLDKASLNRTLISIDSELKRRQKVFNEVRDKLGESTIDIYKYQKYFREGKIEEPMPHLFIISDEFAELKSQQPEFMDDLISAARIGRSLGIHLILATQKPSGVVSDQIWSNSKFRVCLKVQDKSDSNGMLKSPDAAEITNPGRFYLEVGNNEIYVLGQSGWAGTSYIPSEQAKKKYDRSVNFIDNVGNIVKSIENIKENQNITDIGDELTNILKYICQLAKRENLRSKKLWLENIPENIYVDDVIRKYNFNNKKELISVLGEYDAPAKQYQNILTLNLNEEGNTFIYGLTSTNREMLTSALIYSLCVRYTADDVNIYIIDFGSESLRIYQNFNQVGDIVYSTEKDKLLKLMELIDAEMQRRKKLFVDYNGEYKLYINSGNKMPKMLIIINNYDSFKENYASLEENIAKISREGARYGIIFVINASIPSIIYNKIRRNFKNTFVLDMKDKFGYMDVLGKIGNAYPANYDGRGLYSGIDGVCEFQSAQITNPDNMLSFIKEKSLSVNKLSSRRAPKIPSLPDEITLDMLDSSIVNINSLPLGMSKNTLKIVTYDFFKDKATVISSKNIKNCIEILKTIIYGVRKLNNMVVLIDAEQELSSIGDTVNTYADKNIEEVILQFEQFLDREIDGKNIKVLCIIAGLEKFQKSMNEKKFKGFFNGIKTLSNVNLVFVDTGYKLKKVGLENWYSSTVNNINGIWVGDGFIEQTIIKSSVSRVYNKDVLSNQYAYIVKDETPNLTKIVGKEEFEDEE